ncbi:Uncharacterised protein [Klebsiella michiganensis]|uniref:Uncharacterized protein n=1 Tax=Klebsiella michiganensis TaxID=1134687 RepID=A0A7H4N0Z3_9ENTR|nr:Uncharacterised protein [Klebsiella michiganensis]
MRNELQNTAVNPVPAKMRGLTMEMVGQTPRQSKCQKVVHDASLLLKRIH